MWARGYMHVNVLRTMSHLAQPPCISTPTLHPPTYLPNTQTNTQATTQCQGLERAKAALQEELGKAHALAATAVSAAGSSSNNGGCWVWVLLRCSCVFDLVSGRFFLWTETDTNGRYAWTHARTGAAAAASSANSSSAKASSSSSSSDSSSDSDVLMKELRPELGCALCAGLLMDAAVLPCSHAFCFPCLHPRMMTQQGGGKGDGAAGGCPICRCGFGFWLFFVFVFVLKA